MEAPKSIIRKIFEACLMLAISGFLVKLGVDFIICVWKPLLIISGIVIVIVVGYRLYRYYYRDSDNWRDDNDHF